MCAGGEAWERRLEGGGDVDGVLGGDGGDGDELATSLGNEARELCAHVGVAKLCAGKEAVELDPGLLEHAETCFGLVASLRRSMKVSVARTP